MKLPHGRRSITRHVGSRYLSHETLDIVRRIMGKGKREKIEQPRGGISSLVSVIMNRLQGFDKSLGVRG